MKLRRALVTAAATAAIAPIALLSAPGAFADETPGTVGESAATPSPQAPESTPAAETTPSDTATTPAAEDTAQATEKPLAPADDVVPTEDPEKTPGDDEETPTDPADECTDHEDSPGTLAELRGLPSEIVAGSGWQGFTFRVSNYTGTAFESFSADLYAFSYAYDTNTTETSRYLHVQWYDGTAWQDLDTRIESDHENFGEGGPLAPGDHADIRLRIKVDAKAPAGIGGSVAFATSVNTEGVCGYSVPEDQEYRFEILPAATKPGGGVPPATAEPKPSATPSAKPSNTPAPQASSTPLAGSLAATGSSSALPTMGVVGGVAVLAGAGVVYSVRRRRVSDEA
ncbi:peptidase [Streptomyces sp. NPDC088785]|uniref:peptidase n=1 Tax=Streptomyces sp. NPDC088785 TaxID=3365897 RepID=UPI00381C10B8